MNTNPNNKIEFDLKDYLEKNFGEVKGQIKQVDENLRIEIKRVDEGLKAEIKQVDESLKAEIKRVDNKIDKVDAKVDRLAENHLHHIQRSMTWLIGIGTTVSLTIIGLLTKMAFF